MGTVVDKHPATSGGPTEPHTTPPIGGVRKRSFSSTQAFIGLALACQVGLKFLHLLLNFSQSLKLTS